MGRRHHGDARALRSDLAGETGLRAAALFPVRAGGRVAAVLEFTARRMRQPDKRLWQTLGAIGTQIGQFLSRLEAERAVRESEARFRALTNLSSDWYWELDAEYRFTRLEGRQVAGGDPGLLQRLLGARRWETELEVEGGWEVHRAMLDARQPFHDVLMWRRMQDGSVRYMRVSGEAVFNADGSFTGYRGVGRDVTEEKRAEQMLRLEHEVARLLAAAEDASGGLQGVIRAVCEAEGFACGRYFRIEGELARFEDAWAIADPAIAALHRALAGVRVPRGRGPDRNGVAIGRGGVVGRYHARPAGARPQRVAGHRAARRIRLSGARRGQDDRRAQLLQPARRASPTSACSPPRA